MPGTRRRRDGRLAHQLQGFRARGSLDGDGRLACELRRGMQPHTFRTRPNGNAMKTALGIMALVIPLFVGAAEINGLSTIAVQSAMEELIPHFEKASGHKVHVAFGLGVAMTKRVQDGEAADFVLGPRSAIDGLAKAGKLAPGSDAALARSSVAVAVRQGAPKPDISTPDALKRALLAAKAISYSNPAYGGGRRRAVTQAPVRLCVMGEEEKKTEISHRHGLPAPLPAPPASGPAASHSREADDSP